jgi:predicted ester cyclase
MQAKENKALMRRFFKEWNKGKTAAMAVIDELCATNIVLHSTSGEEIRGIKNYKQSMSDFFDAFPDFHWVLDDIIVEGEKVVTRYTMTGTQKGEFKGIPPTNKRVTLWAIWVDRVVGGKFVEEWGRMDTLGFMQQLGAIPTPKK